MLRLLMRYYRALVNRRLYPGAGIALNAFVKDSSLGRNVTIGAQSGVVASTIGDKVSIHNNCGISGSTIDSGVMLYERCSLVDAVVGRFTYVASNSVITKAEIGSFCSFGPDLICGFGDHPTDFVSTSPVFFSNLKQCGISFTDESHFTERKKIFIGNDVWIGARVFIRDGVKIGNGVIIGAGAVVVKDVPDYAIVGGVPAKIIRYRFPQDTIDSLNRLQWWNWPEERLRAGQAYFVQSDIASFIEWADRL